MKRAIKLTFYVACVCCVWTVAVATDAISSRKTIAFGPHAVGDVSVHHNIRIDVKDPYIDCKVRFSSIEFSDQSSKDMFPVTGADRWPMEKYADEHLEIAIAFAPDRAGKVSNELIVNYFDICLEVEKRVTISLTAEGV